MGLWQARSESHMVVETTVYLQTLLFVRPRYGGHRICSFASRLLETGEKGSWYPKPLLLRKEVIHPHLPVQIPCYDLVLIANLAVEGSVLAVPNTRFGRCWLCWLDGQCVQGARTYSPQPADLRLLPIPASCRANFSLQSELRGRLEDWLRVTPSLPIVGSIVGCVLPWM